MSARFEPLQRRSFLHMYRGCPGHPLHAGRWCAATL